MSTKTKQYYLGTGRRKSAVARVRLTSGEGKIVINKREMNNYFSLLSETEIVRAPLHSVGVDKSVDVIILVAGSGTHSQAGACQLGLARALIKSNSEYEEVLRENGYMTRDSREKERKKYGRAGARRSFQFSKR